MAKPAKHVSGHHLISFYLCHRTYSTNYDTLRNLRLQTRLSQSRLFPDWRVRGVECFHFPVLPVCPRIVFCNRHGVSKRSTEPTRCIKNCPNRHGVSIFGLVLVLLGCLCTVDNRHGVSISCLERRIVLVLLTRCIKKVN
jgi:hypothetical protein